MSGQAPSIRLVNPCRSIAAIIFALCMTVSAFAKPKSLQIYFIDVEGGQSTLVVSPSGQSLLIDTGWPDFETEMPIVSRSRRKLPG